MDKDEWDIIVILTENSLFSIVVSLWKWQKWRMENYAAETMMQIVRIQHCYSDKRLKGTVVNLTYLSVNEE